MILEEKLPTPDPFEVLVLKATVGLAEVDHTTPLAVILAPPSLEIFPPHTAVIPVILERAFVETVGIDNGFVVKVLSGPYAVPTLLVA